MMRPVIKVTLYDATSENDCTLLEEGGEYFVNFGNRTGTYREFLRMILRDDRLYPDLVAGDAAASFFALMKAVADRWNDRIKAEVLYAEPGSQAVGNRRGAPLGEPLDDPDNSLLLLVVKGDRAGRPGHPGGREGVQVVVWRHETRGGRAAAHDVGRRVLDPDEVRSGRGRSKGDRVVGVRTANGRRQSVAVCVVGEASTGEGEQFRACGRAIGCGLRDVKGLRAGARDRDLDPVEDHAWGGLADRCALGGVQDWSLR